MFVDIEADIYVMVDGDGTYDASIIQIAIDQLKQRALDMVICTRTPIATHSFRPGHQIGNRWFNRFINFLFRQKISDVFSGYRVLSRRFVKTFPAITNGFEIETEMTLHALQLDIPFAEIETAYRERPAGSLSKLQTIRDGLKIKKLWYLLMSS